LSGSGRYFYPATGTAFHLRIIASRVFTIVPVIRRGRFRGRHRTHRLLLDVNWGIGWHDHNRRINNGRINGRIIITAGRISVVIRLIIRLTIIRIRPPVTIASINSDITGRIIVIRSGQANSQRNIPLARVMVMGMTIVPARIPTIMAPGNTTHGHSRQNPGQMKTAQPSHSTLLISMVNLLQAFTLPLVRLRLPKKVSCAAKYAPS